MIEFWLSVATLVPALAALAVLSVNLRRTRELSGLPDTLDATPPRLSVIVSALNEADTIEPALRSLLAIDYPGLEIIAIDDRSTDATGAILDRVAAGEPRLRVLHIDQLPPGWLGKNHALHRGAAIASGDYLLFTDADVHFDKRALRQAVGHCEREQVDHLAVLGRISARSSFLAAVLTGFFLVLYLKHPLPRMRRSARAYVGSGMFNLVRAAAYRRAGGHAMLPLEVVDDLMLGKLMKARGFRQDAMFGVGRISVEWYPSVWALARGLEKNAFAGVEYSVVRLFFGSIALLVGRYWPIAALFFTQGVVWWMNAVCVAALLLCFVLMMRRMQWTWLSLWWWPLTAAITAAVLWRGVLLTLRRGGIVWRGTLYPLSELRRSHAAGWLDEPAVSRAEG